MVSFKGQIVEISLAADGAQQALVESPLPAVPAPGQYVQAFNYRQSEAPLPASLFLGGRVNVRGDQAHFMTSAPIPQGWMPGDELQLRGPLGRGFVVPAEVKRVALISLSDNLTRLLPLTILAGVEISLFCDAPLPPLPAQVEVNPLSNLGQAWGWADLALFDGLAASYEQLDSLLGIPEGQLPCPAQALVFTDMPCGAIAECGICAVRGASRRVLLACEDGPVFRLDGRGLGKM
jgi:hypothetical protein